MSSSAVGQPVPRKEGREKVTGRARYVDDLSFPDMIHGATVRSGKVARGRIRGISFEPGVPWDEIVVVTAKDIPGSNHVELILRDQPFLADGVVNHPEEPIALLGHRDRDVVERARRLVKVDIEPLPAIFTIDDALARRETIWGTDNIFKSYRIDKGDVDAALRSGGADLVVVEGEYATPAQEQLYIEPQGMIAIALPEAAEGGSGGAAGRPRPRSVSVFGSMQCPYYVAKALKPLFGLSDEQVRVVQTETGGGFGGKEEYPSLLAGHAALLSWKAGGRPVKIIYDRAEDMVATTKRHPSRTRHRTAVTRDGRLVAMDIDFTIDGGAYCTLSPVVLSRGTIHAAGPYRCPNVRIRSRAVATSAPPHGAFRGFGAPQSIFALERHMDRIAARLGIAPEELRRRNFIREGDTTATGQTIREPVDYEGLLEKALAASGWHEKRARFSAENAATPPPAVRRGIGLAAFMHGAGFTGSGEKHLASVAAVEGTPAGRVRVLAASTEIGQGTNTIFAQIAADALGAPVDLIDVVPPDTSLVPNSGPTVASRTCMIVGRLVEEAARALREELIAGGADLGGSGGVQAAIAAHVARSGSLRKEARYEPPPGIEWDEEHYRGDAYGTYAWAVYVAEVAVDARTYEARVEEFTAVQDVGRVIHPVLAAGQIEGGVAQGIGFALYENVVLEGGRMANPRMSDYIVPTSADAPRIRVIFEEHPYPHGPGGGAKGLGELPHDGPAPAVANAIAHALGAPDGPALDRLPLLPEALMTVAAART